MSHKNGFRSLIEAYQDIREDDGTPPITPSEAWSKLELEGEEAGKGYNQGEYYDGDIEVHDGDWSYVSQPDGTNMNAISPEGEYFAADGEVWNAL